MYVNSIDELSEHMIAAYMVSFFNYVLEKKQIEKRQKQEEEIKSSGTQKQVNTGSTFTCLEKSSKSVVLSLLEFGYPNVAYASSMGCDIAYAMLPFVFQEKNKKDIEGTIVAVPNYHTLQFSNNVRNAVFIRLNSDWKFNNVINEADLFPELIIPINTIRKEGLASIAGSYSGKEYFEKAFANPVKIGK
jgi:hypothetical protein